MEELRDENESLKEQIKRKISYIQEIENNYNQILIENDKVNCNNALFLKEKR